MDDEQLEKLKKVAESCSTTCWFTSEGLLNTTGMCFTRDESDFIGTASPANVLSLIRELEELRAQRDAVVADCHKVFTRFCGHPSGTYGAGLAIQALIVLEKFGEKGVYPK